MILDGVTALVTGASRGIGRVIAETLASEGAAVTLAARSDGIYETRDRIGDDAHTLAIETDVTDEGSVEACVERTVEEFGGLDCLVNNAGVPGPTKEVTDVTEEEWAHTMDVNVAGMFRTVKHGVPHLRKSERASVINVASMSGKRPLPNRTPYTASKMAVVGFTRTLAFELGDDDVTANAVCPGATAGPRIEGVIEQQAAERGVDYETAKLDVFTDDAALGELVTPEDTANLVAFLASEKARHITGQDLNVDAGTTWE